MPLERGFDDIVLANYREGVVAPNRLPWSEEVVVDVEQLCQDPGVVKGNKSGGVHRPMIAVEAQLPQICSGKE